MAGNRGAVDTLYPDELEKFMETHGEGSYVLLDLRQPEECEESRIPGAKLVPLPLLVSTIGQLDRELDTILYCSHGGRSLIAAQFLAARGFSRVYHLKGGIDAWEQKTAAGPMELHLKFLRGDESPAEAARIAYRMESGLERFHRLAMDRAGNAEVRGLLEKLAGAEEIHRQRLAGFLKRLGEDVEEPGSKGEAADAAVLEGGLDAEEFLAAHSGMLATTHGCLELAMIIEVQALDLYLRMADSCSDTNTRNVFLGLADEEKRHLALIGALLSAQADR